MHCCTSLWYQHPLNSPLDQLKAFCSSTQHDNFYMSSWKDAECATNHGCNEALCQQARSKIAIRGQQIGLDFDGEVESLKGAADWEAELASIRDASLQLPAYYTQPFHAYPEGNLCWEAALQVI